MRWTWQEFWARVALAAVLTPVARYAPMLFGGDALHWVIAAVIALVVVFAGELLIDAITGSD